VQTQTHVLLALTLLSKKDTPRRNRAIVAGSLIPDAFIYLIWVWYSLTGSSQSQIWNVHYFQNPTQFYDALFNSIPLYLVITVTGLFLAKAESRRQLGQLIIVFGLAALLHIGFDIPVHASDAHRHFWPISDWRFYSRFSYWEADHHATLVTCLEGLLGLVLCFVLWRRFDRRWVRIFLGLLIAYYTVIVIGTLLFITGFIGASA